MHRLILVLFPLYCLGWPSAAAGAQPGDEVVIVYNRNSAASREVAEYYAQQRKVPSGQVFGFDLPTSETMTRSEYDDQLEAPLRKRLREAKLFTYLGDQDHRNKERGTNEFPIAAKVRYAALCYGVPLKILNDPKLSEEGSEKLRPELRRNDAAVDSELALMPALRPKIPRYGVVYNRLCGVTNEVLFSPTNGLLMVARLDGPTPEIARGLVDKALQAERDGLWGRAYFDSRGLTNGSYALGDEWIRSSAQLTKKLGFETVLDQEPTTFPASLPMSQIALYAGWYDGDVSGPFTRPTVEFMPGAFAYHLHSFSAQTIRSATSKWVGPLLAKGATITMGCVEEPYLEGTPNVLTFLASFLYLGFSFGEAAYTCQSSLSWQTTVVGDPLYRPFAKKPMEQHEELVRRGSKLVEWSELKFVNINLANGAAIDKIIEFMESATDTHNSAVLTEKLADLLFLRAKFTQAALKFRKALELSPSPQQQVRLMLSLARTLDFSGQNADAFEVYQLFVKMFPDYPDLLGIYRKLSPLAEQLGKSGEKDHYQREIARLTGGDATGKP